MSLTKAVLLEKVAPRIEWVEVEGFGHVGIRSCSQMQFSRRWTSYIDQATGKIIEEERAKGPIHELIDQLMVSETEPMFDESDFDALAAADSEKMSPLLEAVRQFNAVDPKKTTHNECGGT